MDLIYRPELDNPPMDSECTIGFTFIEGTADPEHITISAGVTRDFPVKVWERIKEYQVTQNLLKLGAIKVTKSAPPSPEGDLLVPPPATIDTLKDIELAQAMSYIEASFDHAQLERWQADEMRVKVRNAITRRLAAITGGNA